LGYLSQVRAGGKQYIYLTEYCGNQDFSSKTEKHIFSFGSSNFALYKMKRWLRNFENEFPDELKEAGYSKEDLQNWINTLETGVTKNGRKFQYERKKRAAY
jgi:hypothetical protein